MGKSSVLFIILSSVFYRIFLLLTALLITVISEPIDILVQQIKASGKTNFKYKLTAKCEYKDAVPNTPAEGVTFQIQLDTPSTKFSVSLALLIE